MRDQDLSRRQFLWGSSAAAAGAMLLPGVLPGTASARPMTARARRTARAATVTSITGATVSPFPYGITGWLQAAKLFDSYVGMPLATTIQKYYMQEGKYFTTLPPHINQLAKVGCQFIICAFPSRSTDDSTNLANFLQFLNSTGIVYQVALVNEWNTHTNFGTPQDYLNYWSRYAPVVQAAGVPLCNLVCASSSKPAYNKIQPGFPTSPLPDRYWIDYYATAYKFKIRLDTPGGLLDQAESLGVPTGIAEFGWSAGGGTLTIDQWNQYCPYLVSLVPRLPLGCLYWGATHNGITVDVVTGPNDQKVPGIQQVISAFQAG